MLNMFMPSGGMLVAMLYVITAFVPEKMNNYNNMYASMYVCLLSVT